MPLLVLAALAPARAADVQFEGFYRARLRGFDTLSLDRSNPATDEGLALYGQHRLWLRPAFLVSDAVALFAEVRGLDGVRWGEEPGAYTAFVEPAPTVFEYDLDAPTSETDATAPLLDLTLWRVWGEVHTDFGRLTFGRVPLHWGSGIWLNDGVTLDRENADFGDTTDRVMWELLVQDEFFLRAAVDVPAERFVGEPDDTTGYDLAVAYRAEELVAGIDLHLDHTGRRQGNLGALNVFTADAAASATLGKLGAEAEFVGQFGGGDLEGGINDVSVTAFGAVVAADLELDAWKPRVQFGLATGDAEPNDLNLKTFTFDRDYSVGMFLFEQPMPTLATTIQAANETNQGRDYGSAQTGVALSNALFLKPSIARRIVDGLWVEASWLGARMAKAPNLGEQSTSRGYGNEFQVGVRFDGVEHFDLTGRFGAFLPGSVYSVEPSGTTPSGFDDPAFGAQVGGRVEF